MLPEIDFSSFIEDILSSDTELPAGTALGFSRAGRSVMGYRLGEGPLRVSLIGGCHADEPVGPRLLRHLVRYLSGCALEHPLRREVSWWIVPHVNPDGEAVNQKWYDPTDLAYHFGQYVRYVRRELPGDDVEFGFPDADGYPPLRPENAAVFNFWRTAPGPFHLHASLHGMALAYGPWFLLDAAWDDRLTALKARCREATARLGYALHDAARYGEKGFRRLGEGFCTRPDARAMRVHFEAQGDTATAQKFHPSSMEAVRSLGGDCLTLVSEMPLFVVPRGDEPLTWPDPTLTAWKERMAAWQSQATDPTEIAQQAAALGLRPMPVADQMRLQWTLVSAGLARVAGS